MTFGSFYSVTRNKNEVNGYVQFWRGEFGGFGYCSISLAGSFTEDIIRCFIIDYTHTMISVELRHNFPPYIIIYKLKKLSKVKS